jgi:hypothetical protein
MSSPGGSSQASPGAGGYPRSHTYEHASSPPPPHVPPPATTDDDDDVEERRVWSGLLGSEQPTNHLHGFAGGRLRTE